ncbi:hypothetical protein BH11MYX1_BH11MYX1_22000 [soil metagenome]
MADPNTRQGKRTPVTLKIKFKSETLEQFIERYAVDVSQGGIFIRTKEPLAVGTQMKFEFQLRDASPLIAGEGTVVWTRENDPSRPAIAPGMGVRFDRLGDGSQNVLEKILAEKAKQAPQRGNESITKPPIFTDTPTRVAPAPGQEQLLGARSRGDSQETPLPKPMPFHSDADEFGAEAFEEATKVRSLDELVAQTAAAAGQDPAQVAEQLSGTPTADRESVPELPSAPEPSGRTGKLLDTSPSPRDEQAPVLVASPAIAQPETTQQRTRLGVEPAKATAREKGPTERVRPVSVAPETNLPNRPSSAPIVIGIMFTFAVAAAAFWYFVLRTDVAEEMAKKPAASDPGSAVAAGPADAPDMVGSAGSATALTGSNGSNGSNGSAAVAVPGPTTETEIASNVAKATVTVIDAGQSGPAPFKAKLEKDKAYKVRVEAPGYATKELDVKGGQDKVTATLAPKLRVVSVTSEPAGGMIYVDNAPTGKKTPFELELTAAQAARKAIHVQVRLAGYRIADQIVDVTAMKSADDKMTASFDSSLAFAPVVVQQPKLPHNDGSGAGSATATPPDGGAGSATGGAESGSATPPPDKLEKKEPTPDKPAGEPEPDWSKNKTP